MTMPPPPPMSAPGRRGDPTAPARLDPQDQAQLAEHPVELRRVFALFRDHRRRLAGVLVLIVTGSILGLVTPFLTKHLVDDAIPHQNVRLLLILVGAMLAVTAITAVLGVLQTWQSTIVGQEVMHRLRTDVFTHLQRMPLSFFTRTRGGEVQSRLTNDINGMQGVVTGTATQAAANLTTVVGTAIAMVALSWRLSLLTLIVLPPAVFFTRRVAAMRREVTGKAQRTLADMQTQIEESLSVGGVQLSKTLGSGEQLSQRFTESSRTLTVLELASQLAGRWRMASLQVIFAVVPALIYLAAGLPATSGGMTIGTLVAFVALQAGIFRPLSSLLNVGVQVSASMALFSRIFEYLDLPITLKDPENPVPLTSVRGDLRVEDVTFSYDGSDTPALRNVSFEVPAGAQVAIVGATGSGKSTLAGLISRLADPDSGRITLDGHDLRDLRLADVSAAVGVVAQDTYLLHTTVRENLRYARADATDEQIEQACRAAHVHEVIAGLPQGYDTVVGARGHRFSGGERQRLALARTILRDPNVLVLDEATSALDTRTERDVQDALDRLRAGRTTITIAHRLSTIASADRIVVLDHGQVVESGTHAELVAAEGRYAALVAAQRNQLDSALVTTAVPGT
ncbi:ABC transporter ATP-binding protein [Dermacoccaceae bacterium W4C1]